MRVGKSGDGLAYVGMEKYGDKLAGLMREKELAGGRIRGRISGAMWKEEYTE